MHDEADGGDGGFMRLAGLPESDGDGDGDGDGDLPRLPGSWRGRRIGGWFVVGKRATMES